MEWKAEYSVGIDEIDNQHKTLIAHFSSIERLISYNKSWSKIHEELLALKEYSEFHFKFEEALMRLFGYPAESGHAAQHRSYLNEINKKVTSRLNPYPDKAVLRIIESWLIDHICGSDREYAEHILSGAKVTPTLPTRPDTPPARADRPAVCPPYQPA